MTQIDIKKKDNDEQIEKYINYELTGLELAEFEMRLKNDHNLKEQVDEHIKLNEDLAYKFQYENQDADLKANLNKLSGHYFAKKDKNTKAEIETKVKETGTVSGQLEINKNKSNTSNKRYLLLFGLTSIAAAVLLFLFNPFAIEVSSDQLADKYFNSYLPSSENYIDFGSPHSANEQLTLGSQYYEANQIDLAIRSFQQIAGLNSENFSTTANWYLALCYLKQNKPERANPLLENLKSTKIYGDDAEAILRQLK